MAVAFHELSKGTNPYIYNIATTSTYTGTSHLSLAPDAQALFINDGDCGEIAPSEHHFSQRGRKRYELNSHLGNTHTIVTDQKHREGVEYVANVTQSRHYFPFGLVDEEYSFINPDYEDAYRYGFNGKEVDEDLQSDDGSNVVLDYGFRIYNPAIARFLSVDPLTKSYPELTPYQFASNSPIMAIDRDGLEYMTAV